jgi:hypothetical protein
LSQQRVGWGTRDRSEAHTPTLDQSATRPKTLLLCKGRWRVCFDRSTRCRWRGIQNKSGARGHDIPARMISISTVFSADLLKRRFWFLGVLMAVVKRVLMKVVLPSPDSPMGQNMEAKELGSFLFNYSLQSTRNKLATPWWRCMCVSHWQWSCLPIETTRKKAGTYRTPSK